MKKQELQEEANTTHTYNSTTMVNKIF